MSDPLAALLDHLRIRAEALGIELAPRDAAEFIWLASRAPMLAESLMAAAASLHSIPQDAAPTSERPVSADEPSEPAEAAFADMETPAPAKGASTGVRHVVSVTRPVTLGDPMGHARGLRSLARLGSHRQRQTVDARASAERSAVARTLMLVLRDEVVCNTHLVMLLDRAGQVEPWRPALRRLVTLAAEVGAFASWEALEVDLSRPDRVDLFRAQVPFEGESVQGVQFDLRGAA